MHTSEYLQRLSAVRRFLSEEACDINDLISKLIKAGFNVSKRQVYFDIFNIDKHLLNKEEELVETLINKQKKVWRIVLQERSNPFPLSLDDTYKMLIVKDTLPVLVDGNNIKNILYQLTSNTGSEVSHYKSNSKEIIIDTNFFQKKFNDSYFKSIKEFYNAIINHKKITILRKVLDATCVVTRTTNFNINPISLIYHSGSMYISGFTQTKKVIILDVSQVVEYSISTKSFNKSIDFLPQLKQELFKRFGVSENIDDKVYDIEIELSTLTGEYLKLFNFHPTQKFRLTDNGYILSLKCGINRELVAWIFGWMDNARILKPEKLKKIYIKQLNSIIRLNTTEVNLNYSNIFTKE